MSDWQTIATAPEGRVVETKIDTSEGVRNVQPLIRKGRLWFFDDMSMYVYYRPTHWRERVTVTVDEEQQEKGE